MGCGCGGISSNLKKRIQERKQTPEKEFSSGLYSLKEKNKKRHVEKNLEIKKSIQELEDIVEIKSRNTNTITDQEIDILRKRIEERKKRLQRRNI